MLISAAGWFWRIQRPHPASPDAGSVPATAAVEPPRLNVLLITLDTTRADHLGGYGRTPSITPQLDRLAAEGTLFERCTACTPLTLPSHCTIMTGLYPFVHNVRRNSDTGLPPDATTLAESFRAAGAATRAVLAAFVLNRRFGLDQGFEEYRDVPPPRGGDPESAQRKGDAVCADALAMLRAVAARPFFLWVHFYDPHYPYESTAGHAPDSPAAYAEEVAFMDAQVGRLLDELRALNLEHRTLVVAVGDHGEGLDEHGEFQHGFFLYETATHVPLIIRCPGVIPAGLRVPARVRTIDLAPTIAALAGAPELEDAQGVNLASLMGVGGAAASPDTADGARDARASPLLAYSETTEAEVVFGLARLRSLSTDAWKYIHSSTPELFELAADPREAENQAAHAPDRAADLRTTLSEILATAPPPLAHAAPANLKPEEIAGLEALGYVGVGAAKSTNARETLESDVAPIAVPGAGSTAPAARPAPAAFAAQIAAYTRTREVLARGQFAEAEAALRPIVAALPTAPDPLADLAFAISRQGRVAEAIGLYESLMVLAPQDVRKRREFAMLLIQTQQWDAALAQAQELIRLAPQEAGAYVLTGNVLARLGRLDEARRHMELAVRREPGKAEAHLALGQVCAQQGDRVAARAAFRKALELNPALQAARTGLDAVK